MKMVSRIVTLVIIAIFTLLGIPHQPASIANAAGVDMNINGKWIRVDNISSVSNIGTLLNKADENTGYRMRAGDRVVVTEKYIVWMDLTRNDGIGGGFLRGLWTLTLSGGALFFRADGSQNELMPQQNGGGSGHIIIANTQCFDDPTTSFYSTNEKNPIILSDGIASSRFSEGVSYKFEGHLYSNTGLMDLNANAPGIQSIKYHQKYDFDNSANFFQVESYIVRDNDDGAAQVAIIINNYDTSSLKHPLHYSSANVARGRGQGGVAGYTATAAAYEVVDIPLNSPLMWWENSDPNSLGGWWISEVNELRADKRALRVNMLLDYPPSQRRQHIYTPALSDYSLSLNPIHNCNTVSLQNGWSHHMQYFLSTEPGSIREIRCKQDPLLCP